MPFSFEERGELIVQVVIFIIDGVISSINILVVQFNFANSKFKGKEKLFELKEVSSWKRYRVIKIRLTDVLFLICNIIDLN